MRSVIPPLTQREALEILERDPGAYLEHHLRINSNPGKPYSHLVTESPAACWRVDWRSMAPLRRSGGIVRDPVLSHVWYWSGQVERRRRYYIRTPRGTVPARRTLKQVKATASASVYTYVRYRNAERSARALIANGERWAEIMREGEVNPVRVLT